MQYSNTIWNARYLLSSFLKVLDYASTFKLVAPPGVWWKTWWLYPKMWGNTLKRCYLMLLCLQRLVCCLWDRNHQELLRDHSQIPVPEISPKSDQKILTYGQNWGTRPPENSRIDLKPRIWAFHIQLRRSWKFQINRLSMKNFRLVFVRWGGGKDPFPPPTYVLAYSSTLRWALILTKKSELILDRNQLFTWIVVERLFSLFLVF